MKTNKISIYIKVVAITPLLLAIFTSCKENWSEPAFVFDGISLSKGDKVIYKYDENTDQLLQNNVGGNYNYGVISDNGKNYFTLSLNSVPVINEKCIGSIEWQTNSSSNKQTKLEFQVTDINAKKEIHLWNGKFNIGVIVKSLD